ncbi:hypothetical protein RFI_32438, partial [Reticulomyxa filosa]
GIRGKFSIPTIRSQNKKIYSREKLSLYHELEKVVKSIQNIVNEYGNNYYNGNNKFFENIVNLCDQQSPGVDDNSQQFSNNREKELEKEIKKLKRTLEEERKVYETKIENMKNCYDKKLQKKVQLETTLKHNSQFTIYNVEIIFSEEEPSKKIQKRKKDIIDDDPHEMIPTKKIRLDKVEGILDEEKPVEKNTAEEIPIDKSNTNKIEILQLLQNIDRKIDDLAKRTQKLKINSKKQICIL